MMLILLLPSSDSLGVQVHSSQLDTNSGIHILGYSTGCKHHSSSENRYINEQSGDCCSNHFDSRIPAAETDRPCCDSCDNCEHCDFHFNSAVVVRTVIAPAPDYKNNFTCSGNQRFSSLLWAPLIPPPIHLQ
ncbi:hypothetical protein [Paraferrimonas haliotis]|uniref:hypothetical protein n=1 Tax=Paraferrimonas haliotis TaxID=2013866 RepID=UPI0011805EE5|nr:hypothetical protein [Paraferrimonas haliotis]